MTCFVSRPSGITLVEFVVVVVVVVVLALTHRYNAVRGHRTAPTTLERKITSQCSLRR